MTNAEWMIKNGYKFSDLRCCFDDITGDIIISLYGIILARGGYIPLNDFLKRWLDKKHEEEILNDEEEQILNDEEKKYLSAVIKPFRDKVSFICKVDFVNFDNPEGCVYQRIVIILDDSPEVVLPLFKSGTIYKGMETGNVYFLEELGL